MGATIAPLLIAFAFAIVFILGVIPFVCGLLLLVFRTVFRKYRQPKVILIYSISFMSSGLLLMISPIIGSVRLIVFFTSFFIGR